MFHSSWAPGHNSSDYPRYYASSPGTIYKVIGYQSAYEPYIIFKKSSAPWCDERFVGYGGNKAACIFSMYTSGISFYVLSDHFIIHQSHVYEESARRNEVGFILFPKFMALTGAPRESITEEYIKTSRRRRAFTT